MSLTLVADVPYKKILGMKNEILSLNGKINWDQFTKFEGDNSGKWYLLYNEKLVHWPNEWEKTLLAVARIRTIDCDSIHVNEFDAKSGYGKLMMDTLYDYFKRRIKDNYPDCKDKTKFTWNAINDKVADHYRKNYTEYSYTGKNEFGWDCFERNF